MKTTHTPPLQKEWEERKRLLKEGKELEEKGKKLVDEGRKLIVEGEKLWEEGNKLWVEGDTLRDEGRELWWNAVAEYYGEDVKVTWREWHKDNEYTCHIGSDVYT